MSRLLNIILLVIAFLTIVVLGWVYMYKRTASIGIPTTSPAATAAPEAQPAPAPAAATAPVPTPEPVAVSSAGLYPKLQGDAKAIAHKVRAAPEAALPVSALTFYQYVAKAPEFPDATGKRIDHFIGGEVLRRCDTGNGKSNAHFGWFEVRPGKANEPPPGREVAPQRIHVALKEAAGGQIEYVYAARRDDVERQFNESWGCAAKVADVTPAIAASAKAGAAR